MPRCLGIWLMEQTSRPKASRPITFAAVPSDPLDDNNALGGHCELHLYCPNSLLLSLSHSYHWIRPFPLRYTLLLPSGYM